MVLTPRKLRFLNLGVGIFQTITGVAILGITDRDSTLPWHTNFVASSARKDGALFYQPEAKEIAQLPIGLYAGVFLLLSAIDHFLVTLPGINYIYNKFLCKNQNPFRWLEYFLSAAVMRVMIAQLSSVTDIHLLFSLFGLAATTMVFGWLAERTNGTAITHYQLGATNSEPPSSITPDHQMQFASDYKPSRGSGVDWTPFIMGFVPHLFSWAVVGCYFFRSVKQGDPPGFVWAIIFILFFLDLLFAVNHWLHFMQVKGWRGFAGGEFWYIILSVTAKQLLAWINYGGTRRFAN